MSTKIDYTIQGAPIDLLALSRFELAVFLCSLNHAGQCGVLEELQKLEGNNVLSFIREGV